MLKKYRRLEYQDSEFLSLYPVFTLVEMHRLQLTANFVSFHNYLAALKPAQVKENLSFCCLLNSAHRKELVAYLAGDLVYLWLFADRRVYMCQYPIRMESL